MTFSLYIKFHVLHFFCKSWIIRDLDWYNTQSRNNTEKSIFRFQISVTTMWIVIKELCNVTSKLPLHLKTPAHFKMGTMQNYLGKFLFTCEHNHISRYYLGNGQTSKKLASKTCRMFLERTNISNNQSRWSKIHLSEGERVPNYARILWNNVIKHPEIFCRFRDFSLLRKLY